MVQPLFRREVIDSRRRLYGKVVMIQPLRAWILTALVTALLSAVMTGLQFGRYARSERAVGLVVPDQGLAKLHAPRAATVTAILVREGQHVVAGTPLITLTSDRRDGTGADVNEHRLALLDDQDAMLAQRIAHARAMAGERRTKLDRDIAGLEAEIAQAQAQLVVQQRMTASAKARFAALDTLVDKGFAAKSDYESRRQTFLAQQAQEGQSRQALTTLTTRLDRLILDRATLPAEAEEAVRELQGVRADLAARRAALQGDWHTTLVAPIDGEVAALNAARGRAADPARPLVTLLPTGARLRAELYVPSRAAGFVKPGQAVRLLYDAFPHQRFGAFAGEIEEVTRTILAPGEVTAPLRIEEPVYRVTVGLTHEAIAAYGETIPLQAGMTLAAHILLERRSLLDWLLDPLRAVRSRA